MRILITERQYKSLFEQSMFGWSQGLTSDQTRETVDSWSKMGIMNQHDRNMVTSLVSSFIPIIGPFIAAGVGFYDAKMYWDEGDKTTATISAILNSIPFVFEIPGVKELGKQGLINLFSKITKFGNNLKVTALENKVIKGLIQNIDEIKNKFSDYLKKIENKTTPQKGKFDVNKKTPAKNKIPWDYKKIKISDNLELTRNPRGSKFLGGPQAEVKNILNPEESVILRRSADPDGVFYYMSAKMSNPRDAGIAFKELKKLIPSGSRFGEKIGGSLSTDSFYSMLRRTKEFIVKTKGYIKLNSVGKKKFQEFIKDPIIGNQYPMPLQFDKYENAKILLDAINGEIKKHGIPTLAKIEKESSNLFHILIPNIELYIP
jgi:hypothetical protein